MNDKKVNKPDSISIKKPNAVQKLMQSADASNKEAVAAPKALPAGVEPGFVYVNDSVFFSQYAIG
jgi:hypothetical protein